MIPSLTKLRNKLPMACACLKTNPVKNHKVPSDITVVVTGGIILNQTTALDVSRGHTQSEHLDTPLHKPPLMAAEPLGPKGERSKGDKGAFKCPCCLCLLIYKALKPTTGASAQVMGALSVSLWVGNIYYWTHCPHIQQALSSFLGQAGPDLVSRWGAQGGSGQRPKEEREEGQKEAGGKAGK